MTPCIPAFNFWWTVSMSVCILGAMGFVALSVAIVVLIKNEVNK